MLTFCSDSAGILKCKGFTQDEGSTIQLTFTCSNSTIETLGKSVKYDPS